MTDAAFAPRDLLEHADFVRRLARSLLADESAAEDLVQETWAAALAKPPAVAGDPRGWLAKVTRNFALRRWRTDARRGERELRAARPEALPSTAELVDREESLRRIVSAVTALSEPYRTIIFLRYYEDLPPRAIAKRLHVPVETVRTRLRRAHDSLRERLAGELGSPERDWRTALALVIGDREAVFGSTLGLAARALIGAGLATLAVVGVRGLVGGSGPPNAGRPVASAAVGAREEKLAADLERADAGSARAPLQAAVTVSGRVLDESGAGVDGPMIWVLGDEDPFGAEHAAPRIASDFWKGRQFPTDAQGRWSAELPGPARVRVSVGHGVAFEPVTGPGDARWVDAPAEDVDFVVRRVPTAVLEVRALQGDSRRPLRDFRVAVHGDPGPSCEHRPGVPATYTLGFYQTRAEGDVARIEVPVLAPEGVSLHVALLDADFEAVQSQQLLLHAGDSREVLFVPTEAGIIAGHVLDSAGNPIEGALVFFGSALAGRGDEPFRAFRAERITGGVRTARDGWFELEGSGPLVTAWHPDFSDATVSASEASRIVLAPRGAIHGRVLDAAGRALGGTIVKLDDARRGPEATTDETGAFAFEHLEAGAHGLFVDGKPRAGVRLKGGEDVRLELVVDSGSLVLELVQGGGPAVVSELSGLLIGLESVFGMHEVEHRPGEGASTSEVTIPERVRPGRYLFFSTQGWTASLEVAGERARVALGSAELIVRAEPRRRLQVVPADADEFVRLMASRLQASAGEDGTARFRVHPGRWVVIGQRGEVLVEVDVPAEGASVEI